MDMFVQQWNMKSPPSFFALVLRALLLIGGVEPNPGPVDKVNCKFGPAILEDTNKNSEEITSVKKKLVQDKVSKLNEDLRLKALLDASPETFHRAVCEGNWCDVKRILQTGRFSVEHRFADRKTPLVLASERGHLSLVRYLVAEGGACVNARDNLNGRSALHWAAYCGHCDVVVYLVTEAKMDPSQQTAYSETPLHLAAEFGFMNVIRFLVGTANVSIHDRDVNGLSAVHVAARHGHLHVVKYLWEKCNNTPFGATNRGWTPLHFVCDAGHLDVVMYLVEVGAVDKNAIDRFGQKAVYYAQGSNCSAIKTCLS